MDRMQLGTEEYALLEEKREKKWWQEYGCALPEIMWGLERIICGGSERTLLQLWDTLNNKDFFEKYKNVKEIAQIYIIMLIFKTEKEAGVKIGILDKGRSYSQLCLYMQKIKFLLYRVDFEITKDAGDEFIAYYREQGTSTVMLEILLNTTVIRTKSVAYKIWSLFCRYKMIREEIFIGCFIEEKFPGDSEIACRLGTLYGMCGYKDLEKEWNEKALQYINRGNA